MKHDSPAYQCVPFTSHVLILPRCNTIHHRDRISILNISGKVKCLLVACLGCIPCFLGMVISSLLWLVSLCICRGCSLFDCLQVRAWLMMDASSILIGCRQIGWVVGDARSSYLFNFRVLLTIHIFICFYLFFQAYLIYSEIKMVWAIVMVEILFTQI